MQLVADTIWTYVHGKYPSHIFDSVLSYYEDGRFFHPAFKRGLWDGKKRFIEYDRSKKLYRFPTGLLTRVCKALDEHEWPYTLEDSRSYDVPEPNYILLDKYGKPTIDLSKGKWDYQGRIVSQALAHGRGIIRIPTGGGKTECGAAIISSLNRQTAWLTHRKNLMYQTRDRLQERLGRHIGLFGDGHRDLQKVTVCMIQTADQGYEELDLFLQSCDVVIGDEAHHLVADSWTGIFGKVSAPWRFGLTATPHLVGAGLNLVAFAGDVIAEVDLLELIERRVLVLPRIWFLNVEEPKLPKSLKWADAYTRGVVLSTERNDKIVNVARVFKGEGKPTLTLVKRVGHGDLLADMLCHKGIRAAQIQGKTPEQERKEIIQKLKEGFLDNVVATADIVGEGTDLSFLSALINATGSRGGGDKSDGESGRVTLQILGRILRAFPGKHFCDYVDVSDFTHPKLKEASRDRVGTLQSEGYSPFIKYWSEYIPSYV